MDSETAKEDKLKQNLLEEIHDNLRARFNKYTRRAFNILPEIVKPAILDIGCGTGIPTIELARLSNGQIVAVDIDKCKLVRLEANVKNAGLSQRIKIVHCSMFDLKFSDNSFDIIWAEGSIAMIGFARGISAWRRLIKTNGYLAVHDMSEDISRKLQQVEDCHYALIAHFSIPGDIWWSDYYAPLEKRIEELLIECRNDAVIIPRLDKEKMEVKKIKDNPEAYGSTFFIMQKSV